MCFTTINWILCNLEPILKFTGIPNMFSIQRFPLASCTSIQKLFCKTQRAKAIIRFTFAPGTLHSHLKKLFQDTWLRNHIPHLLLLQPLLCSMPSNYVPIAYNSLFTTVSLEHYLADITAGWWKKWMPERHTHGIPKSNLVLPKLWSACRKTSINFEYWNFNICESYRIAFSLQVRTSSNLPTKETWVKTGIPVCLGKWAVWPQEWL